MRRKALVVAPAALALSFAACSLVENVDDYSNGPTDSSVDAADTGESIDARDASDDAPNDTGVDASLDAPDSTALDSVVADTKVESGVDTGVDSAPVDSGPVDTGVDAGAPYRHTITIDGANDFTAANEKFSTTSAGFDAYVSWDASALYVAYVGTDFGSAATVHKWLFVYIDVDSNGSTGSPKTETYVSQQHNLPTGFGADAYFAVTSDGSFPQFKKYGGTTWTPLASPGVTFNRNAASSYVEIRIPFSAMAATPPAKLGVVTFLLNEDTTAGEWTWAGLWNGSFTDGKSLVASPTTIGSYLSADFASPSPPNTAANKKP